MASSSEIVPAEDTNPIIIIPQVNSEVIEKPTTFNFPNQNKKSFSISLLRLRNIFKTAGKRLELQNPAEENEKDETRKEAVALSKLIKADLMFIEDTWKRIKHHGPYAEKATKMFEELKDQDGNHRVLHATRSIVKALKHQMSTDRLDSGESDLDRQLDTMWKRNNDREANVDGIGEMQGSLFEDQGYFERTSQFKDLKACFLELSLELRNCLMCFSVFPENADIKRRVMINWWIGEGFVSQQVLEKVIDRGTRESWDTHLTTEKRANDYFDMLLNVGFIESAHRKPKPKVDICRMQPLVRLVINKLAEKASFFEFDGEGNVNDECSKSFKACLFEGKELTIDKTLEKLHTVFNVNAGFLYLSYELLTRMGKVKVLYLGKWQNSASSQVEIVSRKISKARNDNIALDALGHMKRLRFLSLQGVSRIRNLPKSIFKLRSLTILDIRACRDLQKIHDDIGRLVNLTHLDMSECYLLAEMPRGISRLTKLQVLKGFVCGRTHSYSTCTLDDLKSFPDLRKLSIRTASCLFPLKKDLQALNQFKSLANLTIGWERRSTKGEVGISQKKRRENVDVQQRPREDNFQKSMSLERGSQKVRKNKEIVEDEKETETTIRTHKMKAEDWKDIENLESEEKVNFKDDGVHEETKNEKSVDFIRLALEKFKRLRPYKKKGVVRLAFERVVAPNSIEKENPIPARLPTQLIKVDLQSYPGKIPCTWLRPYKLKNLKRLYIRGGDFFDLGQFHNYKWSVTDLRLKYLNELEMDFLELLELFPRLKYLEKVNCPKLYLFPCDVRGIWMKKDTTT